MIESSSSFVLVLGRPTVQWVARTRTKDEDDAKVYTDRDKGGGTVPVSTV